MPQNNFTTNLSIEKILDMGFNDFKVAQAIVEETGSESLITDLLTAVNANQDKGYSIPDTAIINVLSKQLDPLLEKKSTQKALYAASFKISGINKVANTNDLIPFIKKDASYNKIYENISLIAGTLHNKRLPEDLLLIREENKKKKKKDQIKLPPPNKETYTESLKSMLGLAKIACESETKTTSETFKIQDLLNNDNIPNEVAERLKTAIQILETRDKELNPENQSSIEPPTTDNETTPEEVTPITEAVESEQTENSPPVAEQIQEAQQIYSKEDSTPIAEAVEAESNSPIAEVTKDPQEGRPAHLRLTSAGLKAEATSAPEIDTLKSLEQQLATVEDEITPLIEQASKAQEELKEPEQALKEAQQALEKQQAKNPKARLFSFKSTEQKAAKRSEKIQKAEDNIAKISETIEQAQENLANIQNSVTEKTNEHMDLKEKIADVKTKHAAATKIQKIGRGFIARKEQAIENKQEDVTAEKEQPVEQAQQKKKRSPIKRMISKLLKVLGLIKQTTASQDIKRRPSLLAKTVEKIKSVLTNDKAGENDGYGEERINYDGGKSQVDSTALSRDLKSAQASTVDTKPQTQMQDTEKESDHSSMRLG